MARILSSRIAVAALAIFTLGAGLTVDIGSAEARDWRGGGRGGGGGRVAAGVAGGLLLGALAAGAAGGYYGGSGYDGGPGYYGRPRAYGTPGYYGGYDSDYEESPVYDTVPRRRAYYPQRLDYRAYAPEARGPRSSSSPHCRTEYRPYFNGVRYEQRPAQICG